MPTAALGSLRESPEATAQTMAQGSRRPFTGAETLAAKGWT